MMCFDDFFRSFELFCECCCPDDETLARDLGLSTDCLIMIFYSCALSSWGLEKYR